jgi:hypothetical protein
MSISPRRRLRRLLRRLARHPLLEPVAWRIRSRRRGRSAPPPRPKAGDRRARIAVPPRIRAVETQLAELAAGDGPIVAGPWRGSMGVELLYWIPFLRWFRLRFGVDRSRLVAVSRPGAASWYADVCSSYAESPDRVVGRPLPPSLLQATCDDYWRERGPLVHVLDRLVYAPITTESRGPERSGIVVWPDTANDTYPADGGGLPLSALEPGDRAGASAATAAVAGASLLVGAWDARLLLGPMLGVPTLALTGRASASPHLDLAFRAARALESPLLLVDRGQIDLIVELASGVAG